MSMSELWRENKSKDPGLDLASILGAARIMASSLAPDIDVTFAGIKGAATDRQTIALSAKELGDEYPVDGDKVDYLLGLTVHEMGHVLFSPDKARLLEEIDRKLRGNHYYRKPKVVIDIIAILEDVYVDHLMNAFPGYRDYLKITRQHALNNISPDKIIGILNRKVTQREMLNAFTAIALVGLPFPADILPENISVLSKLAEIAQKLCANKMPRAKAVVESWKIVSKLPEYIPPEDNLPKMQEDRPGQEEPDYSQYDDVDDELGSAESQQQTKDTDQDQDTDEADENEEGDEQEDEDIEEHHKDAEGEGENRQQQEEDLPEEAGISEADDSPESDEISISEIINADIDHKVSLEPDVADEVSQALIDKREDLTQMLSLLAKDASTVIAYVPDESGQVTAEARKKTHQVEEQLRRILQDLRLRRTEDYRGLYSGKISSRRLHRVGYGDKRVFQRRERPGEINMAVCLLMDISGSMYLTRQLIEQVVVALCDAFQKEKLEFIALGYSGHLGIAYIARLFDRECGKVYLGLEHSKAWGSTPSYEGLAAAIAQLLRFGGDKPKVLFHCTDGMPYWPKDSIPDLLSDAREKGIIDIHIAMGTSFEPECFNEIYGESMVIKDISEIPMLIEKRLRDKLGI